MANRVVQGLAALVAVLGLVGGAQAGDEGCEPHWEPLIGPGGVGPEDTVLAMNVFTDTDGPALFVGGEFNRVNGQRAHRIARWGASGWSPLGTNGTPGVGGNVYTVESFDAGAGPALYVGGVFSSAGGDPNIDRIAKFENGKWSPLLGPGGEGLSSWALAMAVFNDGFGDALFVGGAFLSADGQPVNRIAKWNGTEWSPLAGISTAGVTGGIVETLVTYDEGSDNALFVGGDFSQAGGNQIANLARWDGTEWSPVHGPGGSGPDDDVLASIVFDDGSGPALFVGGTFDTVDGVVANGVAKWDGAQWHSLTGSQGTGVTGAVRALAVFDDGAGPSLYVAGSFINAGNKGIARIARWDGNDWHAVASEEADAIDGWIFSLEVFDFGEGPQLFAGGRILGVAGGPQKRIARWDGSAWHPVLGPETPGLASFPGSFGTVSSITTFDDGAGNELYLAGGFETAGGVIVNSVARWDGSTWKQVVGSDGLGVPIGASKLTTFNNAGVPTLVVGGSFDEVAGVATKNLAQFDGSEFTPIDGWNSGVDGSVRSLHSADVGDGPGLYVGGLFQTAHGLTVNRIARWDGSDWSALAGTSGIGTDSAVDAMATFDDGDGPALYAGGFFLTAGGIQSNFIAKWDGLDWYPLVGPGGVGVSGPVRALTVFDDGSGPVLIVAGTFEFAGGDPSEGGIVANKIAQWDGSSWQPLVGTDGVGVTDGLDFAEINAVHAFMMGPDRPCSWGAIFKRPEASPRTSSRNGTAPLGQHFRATTSMASMALLQPSTTTMMEADRH